MTLEEFEKKIKPEADKFEVDNCRYISYPREHDWALEIAWPMVYRIITGHFPWEIG